MFTVERVEDDEIHVVEPLIGRPIDPPPALAAILEREARALPVPATVDALTAALDGATAP
jgi:threonine synthase